MAAKRILTFIVGAILLIAGGVAGLVTFGTSSPPQPLLNADTPFREVDFHDLPAVQQFQARDGASLAYRIYQGNSDKTVVLLHGAAGGGFMMHALAKAIHAAGFTVYVPDLRGHGSSGPRGDIGYNGQLEDDVADFARFVHSRQPTASMSLVGHSAGGGLTVRIAGGPYGSLFGRYVVISPMLARDAPTVRPGVGGWAKPFKARYVGLTILDRFGIHRFEDLPVLAFAVPPARETMMTAIYSYRLSEDFTQNPHYLDDLRRTSRPMEVLVGTDDELFYADRFEPLIHSVRTDIPVTIVPGVGHIGIIIRPAATEKIIAALEKRKG